VSTDTRTANDSHVSTIDELKAQFDNPVPESVLARVFEVFGDQRKAESWLKRRRPILGGMSPGQLIEAGDPDQMRHILTILGRIEGGAIS